MTELITLATATPTAGLTDKVLVFSAAFCAIALAAVGSAWGTGAAASSAIGAWKKCYAQNKPAPFQLMIFAGCPLSQTIYGMILMFSIMGADVTKPGIWFFYMVTGVLSGIAVGISAIWQGRACAAACDAFSETGKGFANQMVVICIIETVAIFVMAFSMVLLSSFAK
ncbi:MAG: V-type ATP synthase subunit K [Lentisphaerae bacterium]|nr:V-type ATP synthase subunit K [Lentisphaerota bacterium]